METQKIVNLLNGCDNENSKFATKKLNFIDSESKGNYLHHDPIKFLTKSIESSLCDYSDAYILVTRNIISGSNGTKAAFKTCPPFRTCIAQINESFVDEAKHIDIAMPMYNLTEYSDNFLILLVVYGNLKETNSQKKITEIFLMLPQIILYLLNTNQILLVPFQMVEEKID